MPPAIVRIIRPSAYSCYPAACRDASLPSSTSVDGPGAYHVLPRVARRSESLRQAGPVRPAVRQAFF
jgi:hypothetical protein